MSGDELLPPPLPNQEQLKRAKAKQSIFMASLGFVLMLAAFIINVVTHSEGWVIVTTGLAALVIGAADLAQILIYRKHS